MMPGMSGLEVLKLLRRVDLLIDLPIITVTAKRGARGHGLREVGIAMPASPY
jgi:CheY-like chemotaxis protein